jgi:two-component system, chemotaxis family, protein-glutamate methylesterase/glutaminase
VRRTQIVAIGASLGGLDALTRVLSELPASFGCPIVIVQHRRPDTDTRLVELLSRRCALQVSEPDDKQPLQLGHVFVAPANYHLLVERGFLALSTDPPVLYARPSIDVLFESVADVYAEAAVGVMLTCANEDGAAGSKAIKSAGGRMLVQDPATAESPLGPRAAIAATAVDAVLDLPGIAALLTAWAGDSSPQNL